MQDLQQELEQSGILPPNPWFGQLHQDFPLKQYVSICPTLTRVRTRLRAHQELMQRPDTDLISKNVRGKKVYI